MSANDIDETCPLLQVRSDDFISTLQSSVNYDLLEKLYLILTRPPLHAHVQLYRTLSGFRLQDHVITNMIKADTPLKMQIITALRDRIKELSAPKNKLSVAEFDELESTIRSNLMEDEYTERVDKILERTTNVRLIEKYLGIYNPADPSMPPLKLSSTGNRAQLRINYVAVSGNWDHYNRIAGNIARFGI